MSDAPYNATDRAYAARLIAARLLNDPEMYRLAIAELLHRPTVQGGIDINPFIRVVDLLTIQIAELLEPYDQNEIVQALRNQITTAHQPK